VESRLARSATGRQRGAPRTSFPRWACFGSRPPAPHHRQCSAPGRGRVGTPSATAANRRRQPYAQPWLPRRGTATGLLPQPMPGRPAPSWWWCEGSCSRQRQPRSWGRRRRSALFQGISSLLWGTNYAPGRLMGAGMTRGLGETVTNTTTAAEGLQRLLGSAWPVAEGHYSGSRLCGRLPLVISPVGGSDDSSSGTKVPIRINSLRPKTSGGSRFQRRAPTQSC